MLLVMAPYKWMIIEDATHNRDRLVDPSIRLQFGTIGDDSMEVHDN